MKKAFVCAILFALLTLVLPLLTFLGAPPGQLSQKPEPSGPPSSASGVPLERPAAPSARPAPQLPGGELLIWDSGAKQLLRVPVREYLIGAVASEMPPTWPEEALRAQAVAAHSYALYQQMQAGPEAEAAGYFSADPARRQGFMTDAVLRSYWGGAYEQNLERISGLVDSVLHQVLVYEDRPAAACYHAISCGATEASQNVWSQALPYLQGVDSPLDLASPDYEKTVTYTRQQMYDALTLAEAGLEPDSLPPEQWFGAASRTPAGYVETIQVAGTSLTGPQVRQLLGLRSACFTVEYTEDCFAVTTRGYGHGVGLSQYGACALAEAGRSWQEILAYYFPGTRLAPCP